MEGISKLNEPDLKYELTLLDLDSRIEPIAGHALGPLALVRAWARCLRKQLPHQAIRTMVRRNYYIECFFQNFEQSKPSDFPVKTFSALIRKKVKLVKPIFFPIPAKCVSSRYLGVAAMTLQPWNRKKIVPTVSWNMAKLSSQLREAWHPGYALKKAVGAPTAAR